MKSSFHSTKRAGRIAVALAVILTAWPAQALPTKLPPVDQCSGNRDFDRFRSELRRVVARRDRVALLAMLAPDVFSNFAGATGRTAFAEQWSFDPHEYGNVWDQLELMLSMGCARDKGERVIPSLLIQLAPFSDEEVTDTVLILPGARLYESTGVEAAQPSTVAWTFAAVISRASDTMTGVRLGDGREGFIADQNVYEPIGYRLVINKVRGKWMITAFIAGD